MQQDEIYKLLARMLPALEAVARASDFGNRKKYHVDSWYAHGSQNEALKFALKRLESLGRHHTRAQADPFSIDPESGVHHLAAVAWNAMAVLTILMDYELAERYQTFNPAVPCQDIPSNELDNK